MLHHVFAMSGDDRHMPSRMLATYTVYDQGTKCDVARGACAIRPYERMVAVGVVCPATAVSWLPPNQTSLSETTPGPDSTHPSPRDLS